MSAQPEARRRLRECEAPSIRTRTTTRCEAHPSDELVPPGDQVVHLTRLLHREPFQMVTAIQQPGQLMIEPTVGQAMRINRLTLVLEVVVASQATVSSNARVCPASWRAQGTATTTTPCCAQRIRGCGLAGTRGWCPGPTSATGVGRGRGRSGGSGSGRPRTGPGPVPVGGPRPRWPARGGRTRPA